MGAAATTAPCGALLRRSCGPLLALLLCFQVLRTSQAFKVRDHTRRQTTIALQRSCSSSYNAAMQEFINTSG
jgi:hypothetical protein